MIVPLSRRHGLIFSWLFTVLFLLLTLTEIVFYYLIPEKSLADFPTPVLVIGVIVLWGGAFLLAFGIASWFASHKLRAKQDSGGKWLLWLTLEYSIMAAIVVPCIWSWHVMWS